jgi:hypothetical protein
VPPACGVGKLKDPSCKPLTRTGRILLAAAHRLSYLRPRGSGAMLFSACSWGGVPALPRPPPNLSRRLPLPLTCCGGRCCVSAAVCLLARVIRRPALRLHSRNGRCCSAGMHVGRGKGSLQTPICACTVATRCGRLLVPHGCIVGAPAMQIT